MREAVRKIWLQWHDPEYGYDDDVTWCDERINDDDIEYTRRDIVDELMAACKALAKTEANYRLVHDVHGGDSPESGRAWDKLRRCGDKARAAIQLAGATP